MTPLQKAQIIADIELALAMGKQEITCLRREIMQLRELFDDQCSSATLCHCRFGYYLEILHPNDHHETVYPSTFPCNIGQDGMPGVNDPDDWEDEDDWV
jgi:hypothetical protein